MVSEANSGAEKPRPYKQVVAEMAISSLGKGFDISKDCRLEYCKEGPPLIAFDANEPRRSATIPGEIHVEDIRKSVIIHKGGQHRITSGVLSFDEMSEEFNSMLSLSGSVPCGAFNAMFNLRNSWETNASITKGLAYDGNFIKLYHLELDTSDLGLLEHIRQEVPSEWDPGALAKFIETYGTHVIVGISMGGVDVIHVQQRHGSSHQQADVQRLLRKWAAERFSDVDTEPTVNPGEQSAATREAQLTIHERRVTFSSSLRTVFHSTRGLVVGNCIRRGGIDTGQGYNEWLATVPEVPDAISMSFIPITSWLIDLPGCGFLSRAIDLYLHYTPAREELRYFLEWQLPKQCSPLSGVNEQPLPVLQFKMLSEKLYIDTTQVDSEGKPVTGICLCLGGLHGNILAINLQYFSSYPGTFRISDDFFCETGIQRDRRYLKPVKWVFYSHVYTEPQECNVTSAGNAACIVTRARLHVEEIHKKNALYLTLGFTRVDNAKILRSEWIGTSIPTLRSAHADGSPVPVQAPHMANHVDTLGPVAPQGHWVVTGAQLCVVSGKISLRVKYSVLALSDD